MKQKLDLSLYLVTNQGCLKKNDFFTIISKAIEGGVKVVQLREKELATADFISLGKELNALLKPLRIPLIINDRVDIAHAIDAAGVHLGQSDLAVAEARKILGKEAIIGLSVETIDHVLTAEMLEVDYLAASPVFHTKTKFDCSLPWGLSGLKYACSISRHPIIAIGGIHEGNAREIIDCGAVGIAVVSSIFNAPCPKLAARNLSERMK